MTYQNITLNASSLQDMLILANTNTSGTFWTGIYWMIVVVIFLSSVAMGWEIAFVVSFFAGLMIGMFLLYLGLISMTVFGMTEAGLLFIIIYLMYSSSKNQ